MTMRRKEERSNAFLYHPPEVCAANNRLVASTNHFGQCTLRIVQDHSVIVVKSVEYQSAGAEYSDDATYLRHSRGHTCHSLNPITTEYLPFQR